MHEDRCSSLLGDYPGLRIVMASLELVAREEIPRARARSSRRAGAGAPLSAAAASPFPRRSPSRQRYRSASFPRSDAW
jgi:hypothetical protein